MFKCFKVTKKRKHKNGSFDFAEALNLAGSEGAARFVTFDAQWVKRAPTMSPMPVALA